MLNLKVKVEFGGNGTRFVETNQSMLPWAERSEGELSDTSEEEQRSASGEVPDLLDRVSDSKPIEQGEVSENSERDNMEIRKKHKKVKKHKNKENIALNKKQKKSGRCKETLSSDLSGVHKTGEERGDLPAEEYNERGHSAKKAKKLKHPDRNIVEMDVSDGEDPNQSHHSQKKRHKSKTKNKQQGPEGCEGGVVTHDEVAWPHGKSERRERSNCSERRDRSRSGRDKRRDDVRINQEHRHRRVGEETHPCDREMPASRWDDLEQPRIKQEPEDDDRPKRRRDWSDDRRRRQRNEREEVREHRHGVKEESRHAVKEERVQDKQKPDFGLSGKLAEDTNTYKGVVIKYSQPDEARVPRRRWRLYVFKGEQTLPTLHIHRQSAYLIGRERKIADIPVDHPSCSKQHAVLQYRLVEYDRTDGTTGRRIRPYLIDLESANGSFVNNQKVEPRRFVELLEKDVIKFGFSSREYVLLHDQSQDVDSD